MRVCQSFKEYTESQGLNYSTIKLLLENPYKYAKCGLISQSSEALNIGKYLHARVLNTPLSDEFLISDFNKLDLRKKEHKEVKTLADKKNLILIDKNIQKLADEILKANERIFSEFMPKNKGQAEVSFFEKIDGINCKCRCDWISNDCKTIIDLKFVSSAMPYDFRLAVAKYKYYIQAYFYMLITRAKKFLFIAVEKEPPYLSGVYELDISALELGKDKVEKAFEIYKNYKDYVKADTYTQLDNIDGVGIVSMPIYEFYK